MGCTISKVSDDANLDPESNETLPVDPSWKWQRFYNWIPFLTLKDQDPTVFPEETLVFHNPSKRIPTTILEDGESTASTFTVVPINQCAPSSTSNFKTPLRTISSSTELPEFPIAKSESMNTESNIGDGIPTSMEVIKAIKRNEMSTIINYISGKGDCNIRGMWEDTLLIYACRYNMPHIASVLITRGNADPSLRNERGIHPLLLSCLESSLFEIADLILLSYPHLASCYPPAVVYNSVTDTFSPLTPLLAAVTNGHLDIVKIIFEKAKNFIDVNAKVFLIPDTNQITEKKDSIEEMNKKEDKKELWTYYLIEAIRYQRIEIVDFLLSLPGIMIDILTPDNKNMLFYACELSHRDIGVRILNYVQHTLPFEKFEGFLTHPVSSCNEQCTLHVIARNGLHELIDLIVEYINKHTRQQKDDRCEYEWQNKWNSLKDNMGHSVLYYAIVHRNIAVVVTLLKVLKLDFSDKIEEKTLADFMKEVDILEDVIEEGKKR